MVFTNFFSELDIDVGTIVALVALMTPAEKKPCTPATNTKINTQDEIRITVSPESLCDTDKQSHFHNLQFNS